MSKAELSLREVQLSCLEVLKVFDAFARKNGLRYYLSGGTLLGAVRHKGFIPWDDDVDLMMPRGDYERLLRLSQNLPEGQYRFYSVDTDKNYVRPWARMTDQGTSLSTGSIFDGDTAATFIDIFPIDGVPAGRLATKWFFIRLRINDALWRTATRNTIRDYERLQTLKKVLRKLLKFTGAQFFARRMNRIAMRYAYGPSKFRGVSMITHYGSREKMPAEVFDHAVEVDFEGLRLPAPCGWDTYLTRLYGDYMQLPKEHQNIVSTHNHRYQKSEEAEHE